MSKNNKVFPEVRERAVRLVQDPRDAYGSIPALGAFRNRGLAHGAQEQVPVRGKGELASGKRPQARMVRDRFLGCLLCSSLTPVICVLSTI